MVCGMLLRLANLMNLMLMLSQPISAQKQEPLLCDFVKITSMLACIETFTDQYHPNLAG